mmetsp:Transcript_110039/g.164687  ORF Transcript_110039/g.164687 Transcript_110039/m.164687 type:complete len:571 (+) Transcript_110039:101-1813(+)|eukprot:CAMPEP_0117013454 /NCGR_PEP_ID=MMETSP0472-20121206/11098_1 /TAXON_ID=693140 ORGANISM="Tiarina fusus, Strain LIS" /NCGR_SAMPLE_ID=MMETSP0472 /ASSEMBLY_ACC=CAM_ASM_000603 /LENGTH=570 /DNA_ID=CAMNT_0004716767 /DNA_START=384 /DNA_END=2096 /DNA_ORIENTATION=+
MSDDEKKPEPDKDKDKKDKDKDKEKKEDEEEEDESTGITDPRESDVLCGRGGAALRHPGNQTYRRLVNLNKGLYITCLKTEKLKISRSIVAAIREQRGRFLERDVKKGTWYDIGDKKAIEKTSQALREGQPKLRQKMVEAGQIPPNSQVSMEHQFGNGIYNPTPHRTNSGASNHSAHSHSAHSGGGLDSFQMQQMQQVGSMGGDMPPPPARTFSNGMDSTISMTSEMLMQRLSLSSLQNAVPSWNSNMAASMGGAEDHSVRSRLRPSLSQRGSGVADELGIAGPSISILSDFSAYNGGFQNPNDMMQQQQQQQQQQRTGPVHPGMEIDFMPDHMLAMQQQQQQQFQQHGGGGIPPPPPPPNMNMNMNMGGMSPMMASPSLRSQFDRRRLFAKMKYTRGGSGRDASQNKSVGDGMPDIHMVDSNFSLMSNLSNHAAGMETMSNHGMATSRHRVASAHDTTNGLGSFSDHGMKDSDNYSVGLGSRRSLMSGLSRISDHSNTNSVFSDLSKKIGTNSSSRSVAMSEISGAFRENEDEFDEDDDGFYSYEYKPKAPTSAESPIFPRPPVESPTI